VRPTQSTACSVSGGFFKTLGVPALLGRTFSSADDVRGGGPDGPVSVISYGFWQRRFGETTSVIGTNSSSRASRSIIRVTPPEFFGAEVGRTFDVALPPHCGRVDPREEHEPRRQGHKLAGAHAAVEAGAVARRRDRGAAGCAAADSRRRAAECAGEFRENFLTRPLTLLASATGTSSMRSRYERSLVTLLVVVTTVLLIACANIAKTCCSHARLPRQHEWSVRLALGAPRWRLARQLLVESLILAGVGSVAGHCFSPRGAVGHWWSSCPPLRIPCSLICRSTGA
jgi:hypothetical protein